VHSAVAEALHLVEARGAEQGLTLAAAATATPIVPNCKCKKPAIKKQSHTPKNPGRWFYNCAESKCDVFTWAD